MGSDLQEALRDLFLAVFPGEELRGFLANLPRGREIGDNLPGAVASRATVAKAAAELVVELDQSETALARLREMRPHFAPGIAEIGKLPRKAAPALKAGKAFNPAPALPAIHIPTESLRGFCEKIASLGSRLAGITGPPGAGKSVFAAAVSRQVESSFARVCWLGTEEETTLPALQRQLYRQLGGSAKFDPVDWREGRAVLAAQAAEVLPAGGHLLVVVDDPPDPLDRLMEAVTVHGETTLLFCSENRAGLLALGAHPLAELNGIETSEALALLAAWCKCAVDQLPAVASRIVDAMDRLPMAIAVAGSMVALAANPAAEWIALDQDLRTGRVSHLQIPGLPTSNTLITVSRALRALAASALADLQTVALLPAGAWLRPELLLTLWAAPDADSARRRADELAARSMLLATGSDHYVLHRFLRLILRALDGDRGSRFREMATRGFPSTPALVLALRWRDEDMFKNLIERAGQSEIDAAAEKGVTPLQIASLNGMAQATRVLLSRGADPALADDTGFSPLHCAAQGGDAETITALLEARADQTRRNSGGATALDVAARWGRLEAVRLLAADASALRESERALIWATNHDHKEVVAALLGAGADPDAGPESMTPALQGAAYKGRAEIARLLLQSGADVDRVWSDQTALFMAAGEGHADIVNLLIEAGADAAWKTSGQRTILHQAAQSGQAEMVERLVAAGAQVNASDSSQLTALHVAAALGHAEAVEALLSAGADPDPSGQNGFTPLLAVVAHAQPTIRQSAGVRMDETGVRAAAVTIYEPISPATLRIIRTLVFAGAAVNTSDASGRTALHRAVQLQSPELVDLLLELGANPMAQDQSGRTPRDLVIAGASGPLTQLRASAVNSLLGA